MRQTALIVRTSALGDIALTTGPIQELMNQKPDLKVELLTSEAGAEIYNGHPYIRKIHVLPKSSNLKTTIKLFKSLGEFDYIIDWQGNLRSHLLPLFVKGSIFRIKKQSKARRKFVKTKKSNEQLRKHVVEKYFQTLVEAFDLKIPDLEELRPFATASNIVHADIDFSKAVVIHPYASQKNKEWPHMLEFCQKLEEQEFIPVIVGHSPEKFDSSSLKLTKDFSNKTTITEMMALIKKSQALVTTDSGPMHLGVAVGTPTLALFGPTTKEFGFYPKFQKTKVVEIENLNCRPCHVHGGNECPLKHHNCMQEIRVNETFKQLKILLKHDSPK